MKKLASLLICAMSFNVSVIAQDKVASYSMSIFEGKGTSEYEVEFSNKSEFYVSMHSLDASSEKGGIVVPANDLEEFKSALDSARKVYASWVKLVQTNAIEELDKEMEIDCPKVRVFFLYGKWHFDANRHRLKFRFKIMGNKQYALILTTGKMQASDNQFIDSDGAALVLISEGEIQEFLSTLDIAKATAFLEEKKKKADLFKQ